MTVVAAVVLVGGCGPLCPLPLFLSVAVDVVVHHVCIVSNSVSRWGEVGGQERWRFKELRSLWLQFQVQHARDFSCARRT